MLILLASSAGGERVFSAIKWLWTDRRASMLLGRAAMLAFVYFIHGWGGGPEDKVHALRVEVRVGGLVIGRDGSERACDGQERGEEFRGVEDVFDAADLGGGRHSGRAEGRCGVHGAVIREGRRDIAVCEGRDHEDRQGNG